MTVEEIFALMSGWTNEQLAEAALMWVNLGILRVEPDHRQVTLLRDTHVPLPASSAPGAVRYQGLRPYQLSSQVRVDTPVDGLDEAQATPNDCPLAAQQHGSNLAAQDGRDSR